MGVLKNVWPVKEVMDMRELGGEQNAQMIGTVLGELVKVEDPMGINGIGRSFLRIRVAEDMKKPLVAGFWVLRGDKGKMWSKRNYEDIKKEGERKGDMKNYGLWMKATPVRVKDERSWWRGKEKGDEEESMRDMDRGMRKEDGRWKRGERDGNRGSMWKRKRRRA
ncbi:hypothetical protein CRYUN_Cryun30bG0082600 [Craigia yunnanensis]